MMTDKNVNYTAEQVAKMVADYNGGKGMTVEAIAEAMGKSVRSVVGKLSREKVYVAKSKTSGSRSATKAENVAALEKLLGANPGDFASFEKATAGELNKFLELVSAYTFGDR